MEVQKTSCLPVPDSEWRILRTVTSVAFEKMRRFDAFLTHSLAAGLSGPVAYDLPYPKSEFLCYLCDVKGMLAHGTSHEISDALRPEDGWCIEGEEILAPKVYAAVDAIHAMWFAITDRERWGRGTNNGCSIHITADRTKQVYYHYAIDWKTLLNRPYKHGTVYFFPNKGFRPSSTEINETEWVSYEPVEPQLKVAVAPHDFPYLSRVWGHEPDVLKELRRMHPDRWSFLRDTKAYPIRPART